MCKEKGFSFPLNVSMESKTNNVFPAIKKKPKNKSKPGTLNCSLCGFKHHSFSVKVPVSDYFTCILNPIFVDNKVPFENGAKITYSLTETGY